MDVAAGMIRIVYIMKLNCHAQIHARDEELMSTVSSFVYLHHMCERGCYTLPRAPLEDTDSGGTGVCIASSAPQTASVPFDFNQLLPKCRIIGFTLDAFPEGMHHLLIYSTSGMLRIMGEQKRQGRLCLSIARGQPRGPYEVQQFICNTVDCPSHTCIYMCV